MVIRPPGATWATRTALVLALVLASALSACGGSSSPKPAAQNTPGGSPSHQPVTITMP